ncbi:MAG TPA: MFS transporter [Mycobacteriales bacterium]|nr:MFS transporter [Mycobacteriales bacterium]
MSDVEPPAEEPRAPAAESRAAADPLAAVEPPGTPPRAGLRRATLDLGPLRRSRDFRLLFAGQAVSFTGSMVTYVALPYQLYSLTHSSLLVGLLGLTELGPLLVTALLGGAIADAFDRRRTVLLTEVATVALTASLLLNASLDRPRVWPLYVVSGLFAAVDGLQRPSLDALLPRVVARPDLPAAIALASLRMNVGLVAGPPLGGLLIATAGLPTAYGFDLVSFAASLAALTAMRATPPPPDAERPSLAGIVAGWHYARSRQELLGTYLVDINAMLFGMPNALLPAIATRFGGADALGVLYAAPSVGSLVATVTSGWTTSVQRHGRAVALAAASWGVAIIGFGFAPALWVAALLLALAGAADDISGLFRSRIWNETVPDNLRGRVAGIEMLSYSIGPLLGNVESGGVAAMTTVRVSVVSGGVLCVVGTALLALVLPKFISYDASRRSTPDDALRNDVHV